MTQLEELVSAYSDLINLWMRIRSQIWENTAEDVKDDVQARLVGGRGGLGLVDENLSDAIKKMKE